MKRFGKFIDRRLVLERAHDQAFLQSVGIEQRWVPDELEIFDEVEFGVGTCGQGTVVLVLVLEKGQLKRLSLGYVLEGEDDFRAFSEEDLGQVLEQAAPRLLTFFEQLLPPDRVVERQKES
jgi:hypothetical protein